MCKILSSISFSCFCPFAICKSSRRHEYRSNSMMYRSFFKHKISRCSYLQNERVLFLLKLRSLVSNNLTDSSKIQKNVHMRNIVVVLNNFHQPIPFLHNPYGIAIMSWPSIQKLNRDDNTLPFLIFSYSHNRVTHLNQKLVFQALRSDSEVYYCDLFGMKVTR
jgi:hypothetical protein